MTEEQRLEGVRSTFESAGEHAALAMLASFEAEEPENPVWPFERGCLHAGRDRHTEAAEAFRRVLAIDDQHLFGHVNLGMHLDELWNHAEALDVYDRALTLAGGRQDEILLTNRANTLLALDRFEEARDQYREALVLDPTGEALRGLQTVLGYLGLADEMDAVRPDGGPFDRGPFHQLTRELDSGERLVLRFWGGRHTRVDWLLEQAEEVIDWIRSRESVAPGLSDGMRIQFGWDELTIRKRDRDLVVCAPDFGRNPFEHIVWDVGFMLQTLLMQSMLHDVTELPPTPCSMRDLIAIQRAAIDQPVLVMYRHEPDAENGFSGWFIGSEQAFEEPLSAEDFTPMVGAALVEVRHHLIKATSLPPGTRVRFEAHAVTSVIDPEGTERWDVG